MDQERDSGSSILFKKEACKMQEGKKSKRDRQPRGCAETFEIVNSNVEQAPNFLHYLALRNPNEKGSSPKAIDPLNPRT